MKKKKTITYLADCNICWIEQDNNMELLSGSPNCKIHRLTAKTPRKPLSLATVRAMQYTGRKKIRLTVTFQ